MTSLDGDKQHLPKYEISTGHDRLEATVATIWSNLAMNRSGTSENNPPDIVSGLSREASLVGTAFFGAAEKEWKQWQTSPQKKLPQLATSCAVGLGIGCLSSKYKLVGLAVQGLGAGAIVAALADKKEISKVSVAFVDTWHGSLRLKENTKVIEEGLGKFTVDTVVFGLASGGASLSGAKYKALITKYGGLKNVLSVGKAESLFALKLNKSAVNELSKVVVSPKINWSLEHKNLLVGLEKGQAHFADLANDKLAAGFARSISKIKYANKDSDAHLPLIRLGDRCLNRQELNAGRKYYLESIAGIRRNGKDMQALTLAYLKLAKLSQLEGKPMRSAKLLNLLLKKLPDDLKIEKRAVSSELNRLALSMKERKYLPQKERYLQAVYQTDQRLGNLNNLRKSTVNLADVNVRRSKFGPAADLYRQSLSLLKKERLELGLQVKPETYLHSMEGYANCLRKLGYLEQAETIISRSLAYRQKVYGTSSVELVPSLKLKAHLLWDKEDYPATCNTLKSVLIFQERALNQIKRSPTTSLKEIRNLAGEIITGKWQLAELYCKRGMHELSRNTYLSAQTDAQRHFGAKSAENIKQLKNLAVHFTEHDNHKAALSYLQKIVELKEQILGPQGKLHPSLVNPLLDVADCMRAQPNPFLGRENPVVLSKAYLERAAEIIEANFGRQSPRLIDINTRLGAAYALEGDLVTGELLFKEAVCLTAKHYPKDRVKIAEQLLTLHPVFLAKQDYSAIGKLLGAVSSLYKGSAMNSDEALAVCHYRLAQMYLNMQRLKEAESQYLQSLSFQKRFGSTNPIMNMTMCQLARAYINEAKHIAESKSMDSQRGLKRALWGEGGLPCQYHTMAENLLLQIDSNYKQFKGVHVGEHAIALNELGVMYYDSAKYALAQKFYNRALEIAKHVYDHKHHMVANIMANIEKNQKMLKQ